MSMLIEIEKGRPDRRLERLEHVVATLAREIAELKETILNGYSRPKPDAEAAEAVDILRGRGPWR